MGRPKRECGAITGKGTPCKRKPVKGCQHCRQHGGKLEQEARARLPSGRYHRLAPEIQTRVDDALKDPRLLDVRRPIALGQVIMEEAPLIPGDEVIRASVRRKKRRAAAGMEFQSLDHLDEWCEPSEAEMEVERLLFLDNGMRLLERFSKRQTEAAKSVEMGRLLNERAVPMLAELGTRLAKLIDRYVDERKREEFRDAFRMECRMLVQEIAETELRR